ncbi:MAG: hypothetical protein KAQ87_00020 [Candidatus Pacebacteria bacterium]|nr:hypothetical protein [Candidatus Paceibacterota bacterium]
MNYQKEKRPIDESAEETYSWLKKKIVFMKKTRVKTWQGTIILAFVIGMFSYLILSIETDTHIASRADGETASLALSPTVVNVEIGDTFILNVLLNTDSNNAVVARAIVNYDADSFSLTNWNINNSVFDSSACASEGKTACEIIDDTTNGVIDITLAKPSPGVNSSSGLIAALTFQALRATTENITISFTSGSYSDSDVIFDGIGSDGAGTDILNSVTNTAVTITAPTCASFTYSGWSVCQPDSTQSRTVASSSPSGCVGGSPVLTQSCVYDGGGGGGGGGSESTICASFTYNDWSVCQPDSTQSRTVASSSPSGCVGGNPVLTQSCVYGGGSFLPTPSNFKAVATDEQITLTWNNPTSSDFVGVLIIKKEGSAPSSASDGEEVYKGNKEECIDTNLSSGAEYYYAAFSYDDELSYSQASSLSSQLGGGESGSEEYPDGTLLKIPESFKVYVVIDQKKKWIPTPEVFETLGYQWGTITILDKTSLANIPDYEDNLIRAIGNYKVYLVVSGIKRHIPNPEIFLDYGFAWEDVVDTPQATIDKYSRGYLIRESRQGTIYYLSPNGVKKWIRNPEIFVSYNNKWEDIQVISKREMDSYPESNLIRLSGTNEIYFIEGATKHYIPTAQVFNKHHLDWNVVLDINEMEFNYYKRGADLN